MEDINQNPKVIMVIAAGKALDYKKINPDAPSNEVIQHVMFSINAMSSIKINAIAAANRALKYKEENPRLEDKMILQRIMNEASEIIETAAA